MVGLKEAISFALPKYALIISLMEPTWMKTLLFVQKNSLRKKHALRYLGGSIGTALLAVAGVVRLLEAAL